MLGGGNQYKAVVYGAGIASSIVCIRLFRKEHMQALASLRDLGL